jgi:hypothetical protein
MIGMTSGVAMAGPVTWTDWTVATGGNPGTATGTMGGVTVSYAGDVGPATQTFGGIDYWDPATPYLSPTVDNAPPCCDIISLITGPSSVTFSSPVVNPIFAIVSMGQPGGYFVSYDFDADFNILSEGTGYWGGDSDNLDKLPGFVLQGEEGHGAIQFIGTFNTISWTTAPAENWHGFTIGVASVPDPASTLVLLGIAGAALAAVRRRKNQ